MDCILRQFANVFGLFRALLSNHERPKDRLLISNARKVDHTSSTHQLKSGQVFYSVIFMYEIASDFKIAAHFGAEKECVFVVYFLSVRIIILLLLDYVT
jgi:hypothetical protein